MGRNPRTKTATTQRKRQTKPGSEASPILPPPAALDASRSRRLYSTMLGCRMLAERAQRMSSQGLLAADVDTAAGCEAPEVGALINLGPEDCVASGRREYMARFIQGAPLRGALASLCRGSADEHNALPASRRAVDVVLPTFDSQISLAMGAAWAFKLQKRPLVAVSVSSFGDPSSRQSIIDAVNFSAAYQLPIVHIVLARAGHGPEMRDAEAFVSPHTLPCFVVDGSDVVAVYRVAQEAVRRARQGHGPALVECRMNTAMATARADRSLAAPPARERFDDPLEKMEAHLRSKNLWSDKWKMKLVERFTRNLDRAVSLARPGSGQRRTAKKPLPSSSGDPTSGRPAAEDGSTFLKNAVTGDTGRLAGSRS